jgi:tRNA dimethylallyltransferase
MMEEVTRLLDAGYDPERPPMDGIGYRPLVLATRGLLPVDEALRLMIRDTTRYAKRQMTWFARDPEIRWLDVDEAGGIDGAAETVLKQITQEGLTE